MPKLCGLIFASALLCAGSSQAFQLNMHTPPTIHALNPQPLPPGIHRRQLLLHVLRASLLWTNRVANRLRNEDLFSRAGGFGPSLS
jgi:hypothetical protein